MLSMLRGIDHESTTPSRQSIQEFLRHSSLVFIKDLRMYFKSGDEGRAGKGCGKSGRGQAGDLVC